MLNTRFWLFCCLALLGGAAGQAHADRYHYPFDDEQALLGEAAEFESWHTMLERHAEQRDALYACAETPKACRGRLRSFSRLLTRAGALSPQERVEVVNYYINRNDYDDDFPQRIYDADGKRIGAIRNHWTTLYDFLTSDGDCEDYATSKYFLLRELGFAAEDLRVVVVYSRELRGYHAVLAVRFEDASIWLLDTDNRIRKRSHRGYRYVYAINEEFVWDHRDDYRRSP